MLTNTSVVSSDAVWTGVVVSTVRMKNLVPVLQFCVPFSDISAIISHPDVLDRLSSVCGLGWWTLKSVDLVLSACSSTAIAGVRALSFQVVPFHVLPYHQIPTRSTTWDVLVFLTAPLWFHPGHPLVL